MKKFLLITLIIGLISSMIGCAYAQKMEFSFDFNYANPTSQTSRPASKADNESRAYITITNRYFAAGDKAEFYIIDKGGTRMTEKKTATRNNTANLPAKTTADYIRDYSYGSNTAYNLRAVAVVLNEDAYTTGRFNP